MVESIARRAHAVTLLPQATNRARKWLVEEALPLWATAGQDSAGMFHERLGFDAQPDLACPRRMRVQARQLYVYSEAAVRGWWPQAQACADAGFSALMRNYWARDGDVGFVHLLDSRLEPLDNKRDTYDHAFGLFALAWYYRASKDPQIPALAHEILDMLEARLADPINGGFFESVPAVLPRRSDPHMHLLEAMLAWSDATGEPRFLDHACRLTALFRRRWFSPETGTLGENFTADLGLAPGVAGEIVWPGHHFEWFWLLAWAEALGAGEADSEAQALYDYAIRHGVDAQGFAVDECDRHGRQVRRSRRAWPQTELIKAYVIQARRQAPGAEAAAANLTIAFLDTYLATDVPGLWMDQFDEQGQGVTRYAPASTFYHVAVAFRELLLLAEQTA
jgi:mannose-6-phosphate isomerase